MRLTTAIAAAVGLLSAGLAGQASAEPKVYAYPSSANYCPAGLQPVTLGGAIGCGTPNQPMTYAEVKGLFVSVSSQATPGAGRRVFFCAVVAKAGRDRWPSADRLGLRSARS